MSLQVLATIEPASPGLIDTALARFHQVADAPYLAHACLACGSQQVECIDDAGPSGVAGEVLSDFRWHCRSCGHWDSQTDEMVTMPAATFARLLDILDAHIEAGVRGTK